MATKNLQLSSEELQEHVDYVRHPCMGWEEMINKMMEEQKQKSSE